MVPSTVSPSLGETTWVVLAGSNRRWGHSMLSSNSSTGKPAGGKGGELPGSLLPSRSQRKGSGGTALYNARLLPSIATAPPPFAAWEKSSLLFIAETAAFRPKHTPRGQALPFREIWDLSLYSAEGELVPIREISQRGPFTAVASCRKSDISSLLKSFEDSHRYRLLLNSVIEYSMEFPFSRPARIWLTTEHAYYLIMSVAVDYQSLWVPFFAEMSFSGNVINVLLNFNRLDGWKHAPCVFAQPQFIIHAIYGNPQGITLLILLHKVAHLAQIEPRQAFQWLRDLRFTVLDLAKNQSIDKKLLAKFHKIVTDNAPWAKSYDQFIHSFAIEKQEIPTTVCSQIRPPDKPIPISISHSASKSEQFSSAMQSSISAFFSKAESEASPSRHNPPGKQTIQIQDLPPAQLAFVSCVLNACPICSLKFNCPNVIYDRDKLTSFVVHLRGHLSPSIDRLQPMAPFGDRISRFRHFLSEESCVKALNIGIRSCLSSLPKINLSETPTPSFSQHPLIPPAECDYSNQIVTARFPVLSSKVRVRKRNFIPRKKKPAETASLSNLPGPEEFLGENLSIPASPTPTLPDASTSASSESGSFTGSDDCLSSPTAVAEPVAAPLTEPVLSGTCAPTKTSYDSYLSALSLKPLSTSNAFTIRLLLPKDRHQPTTSFPSPTFIVNDVPLQISESSTTDVANQENSIGSLPSFEAKNFTTSSGDKSPTPAGRQALDGFSNKRVRIGADAPTDHQLKCWNCSISLTEGHNVCLNCSAVLPL